MTKQGFAGFTDSDFAIFELPTFDERMAALKSEITPKLKELGAELASAVSEAAGGALYPHVALHLRRSVNPPEETWVAFARDRRGYKPYMHFRVAINGSGVKVACYTEEYSEDKLLLAAGMARCATPLAAYLARHPRIRSHDAEANYGKLLDGRTLKKKDIAELAARMQRVKSQHSNFAIRYPSTELVLRSASLVDEALAAIRELTPLYHLGVDPKYRIPAEG